MGIQHDFGQSEPDYVACSCLCWEKCPIIGSGKSTKVWFIFEMPYVNMWMERTLRLSMSIQLCKMRNDDACMKTSWIHIPPTHHLPELIRFEIHHGFTICHTFWVHPFCIFLLVIFFYLLSTPAGLRTNRMQKSVLYISRVSSQRSISCLCVYILITE